MPPELCIDQLPKYLRRGEQTFAVGWRPIVDAADELTSLLVVLSDITESLRRQEAEQEQKQMIALFERLSQDDRITTRVHIGEHWDQRRGALLAHATQVDPESPFWFGLPRDVAAALHPWDDYQLARSEVSSDESKGDLFDGIA